MNKWLIGGVAVAALSVPALAQMAHRMDHDMTRAEVQARVHEHFARADANHDGAVTREEIGAGVEARMAEHRGTAFDRLDADHDGKLSREEFMARRERIVERRTTVMREDGDGPHGGHRTVMMRHGGGMGGMMLAMADTDKDGRVTEKEALAATLGHFDRADANHDNTLSADERHAAHQAMMGMAHPPKPPIN